MDYLAVSMNVAEKILFTASQILYCAGYAYAVWHFLTRNKDGRRYPAGTYAVSAALIFLTAVLSLNRENILWHLGVSICMLSALSCFLFNGSRVDVINTVLFGIALSGSYIIFNLCLIVLSIGQGNGIFLYTYQSYILTAGYLFLTGEYIVISGYFAKVFREKEKIRISNSQTVLFLALPFLILLILLACYLNGDVIILLYGYETLAGIAAVLAVFHILVIGLFAYMIEQQKKNLNLHLYEQQGTIMMHQYRELEEKYRASRKVIHDVKNHMQMLERLYHSGDLEAADRYCQDISGMLRSLERVVYTDNRMLNLILNEKLNTQELQGVRLTIRIAEADFSFMRDIDLTTVFTNLLDNAKEAAAQAEGEKFIVLKIDRIRSFLVIRLENACGEQEKKKGRHMGLGLENVRTVIEVYGGTMDHGRTKEGYQVSITLPAENKNRDK